MAWLLWPVWVGAQDPESEYLAQFSDLGENPDPAPDQTPIQPAPPPPPGQSPSPGFDDVAFSKHNIHAYGEDSSLEEVCQACHYKKGDGAGGAPMWDPGNALRSYEILHLVRAWQSKNRNHEAKPFGPSYTCLTCHDGILGDNVHSSGLSGTSPGVGSNVKLPFQSEVRSRDHPNTVAYPRRPNGTLVGEVANPRLSRYWSIPDRNGHGVVLPSGPKSAALGLQNLDLEAANASSKLVRTFMGVIHCDTCHNPHLNELRPFLRVPQKTLCLVCHDR